MSSKFSYTFLIKLSAMVVGFFISIYIVKALPVEQYGVYSLLSSIISLAVMIFTFNIQELLFIKLTNEKNNDKIIKIISTTNTSVLFIYSILLILILYTPIQDILLELFNIKDNRIAFTYTVYYILFYSLVLTFMRYLMFSSQPIKYSIYDLLIAILWVIPFLFFGIISVEDIMKYKMISISFLAVTLFYLFYKRFHKISLFIKFDFLYLKEALHFGLMTFLPSIAIYTLTVIDIFLLSYLDSNKSVALFSFANMPFNILTTLIASTLTLVLLPKINKYHKNRITRKYLLFSKIFELLIVILLPITIFMVFYSKEIIAIMSKNDYLEVSQSYIVLSIILFLTTISNFLKQDLYLHKSYKKLFIVFLLALIINISVNYYLIPLYSYMGSIYSILITFIYIFISLLFYTKMYKKVYIRYKNLILILSINIIFFILLFCLNYILNIYIKDFNIVNNIIKISFSSLILFSFYFYINYKNKMLRAIKS
jgi:O-antigen/teichoic acid export membrane protein